tara:strand:- start:56414 stop:56998 length:585 start_codon:yes stop_codon:yes gene_type:complete
LSLHCIGLFLLIMKQIHWLTESLFDEVLEKARSSPRLRTNHNFHDSMEENPHRFLNVMLRGTYIRPHRHLKPPKTESFLIIRGAVAFTIFDESGKIQECRLLGEKQAPDAVFCQEYGFGDGLESQGIGVDIVPGLWHTLTVISDECVCFEVKPGPYQPADDKEFAAWAPKEGEANVPDFVKSMETKVAAALQTK